LREQRAELQKNMSSLEKLALGCPTEAEKDKSQAETVEAGLINPEAEAEKLLQAAEGEADQESKNEEEMKKERKKWVEEFAKDSTEKMLKFFEAHLANCENKEKAQKIIPLKVRAFVMKQAKRFIEEGGVPDYGYKMNIGLVEHDSGEGKKKFVSEINIEPYQGAEEALKEDEEDRKEKLLDKDDATEIEEAQKEGELKQEKIKKDK